MTLEQFNELVNKGYIALGLMAIAFALLLNYLRSSDNKISKKTKKTP